MEIAHSHEAPERRGRQRFTVAWEARFTDGETLLGEGRTRNLSSQGFYCVTDEPLTAGDGHCTLVIPLYGTGPEPDVLLLECAVRVLRVEQLEEGGQFGAGCQIRSYRVVKRRAKAVPA